MGAFNGTSLSSVTIPHSVTSIGTSAFGGTRVTSVGAVGSGASIEIPPSITSVDMFSSCSDLTTVEIPSGVTFISGFLNCTSLSSVTIPDSVTRIGTIAFQNCDSLSSITIPSSVTLIGDSAFSKCDNLTEITIPDGVTSIGNGTFYSGNSLFEVTIGSGVTSIGDEAFYRCMKLKFMTCKAVTPPTVGYHVFYDVSLAALYVPSESVDAYKAADGWSRYKSYIHPIPNQ